MSFSGETEEDAGAADDESLAHFLESEILSADSDVAPAKRPRLGEKQAEPSPQILPQTEQAALQMETGFLNIIPPELFRHIFKFLSSEDLISCCLACKLMNLTASDEYLWHRLYCIRWGKESRAGKLRQCSWKKLYIQHDQEEMTHFIQNCPIEFREYYIQMQAAKRSQTPIPSQVHDDSIMLDKTVSEQVSIWKSSKGLSGEFIGDHSCSGDSCTYTHIGNVFLCEKTGRVHVCDDTCREIVLDQLNGHFVCTISGHVFDSWLSLEDESNAEQGEGADEAEPFMGSGRFARAYFLGYNCHDEKELEATLRFC